VIERGTAGRSGLPEERGARREPRRLERADFNRPSLAVARALLGKYVVRTRRGRRISAMITEVEAYRGPADRASHAYGGRRTPRVEALYADGGTVYVYFVYGMHWMLNLSTAGAGRPEGVLVRGILSERAGERELVAGPGRVARHLEIDRALYGVDATRSRHLWLEDRGVQIAARHVRKGPRVGIDFAGPYWAARPWRFWIDVEGARIVR
jgi:DNA-3-methyladenine glycosylase